VDLAQKVLLKDVIEGKIRGRIDLTGRRGKRSKQLLDDLKEKRRILEIERGCTRSHCVEYLIGKRLWASRATY
jgi:GR25 family glycosyltransferase involved in LPS biosynthesis